MEALLSKDEARNQEAALTYPDHSMSRATCHVPYGPGDKHTQDWGRLTGLSQETPITSDIIEDITSLASLLALNFTIPCFVS